MNREILEGFSKYESRSVMITAEGQRNRTVTLRILETCIGHLLRQLLPIDAGIGETGQLTSEAETVGDHVSGNVD